MLAPAETKPGLGSEPDPTPAGKFTHTQQSRPQMTAVCVLRVGLGVLCVCCECMCALIFQYSI